MFVQRKDAWGSKVVRSGWIPRKAGCKLVKKIRWPVEEMKPLLFDKSRIGLDKGLTEEMNGQNKNNSE